MFRRHALVKLLDSFAIRPGLVRADPTRNLLLIQGTGPERRNTIETALSFDADWMRGQSVGIFPVQYSSPEPIIAELEKILDSGDGGLSQGNIKFQVMARMNGILVVTKKPGLLRAAETWIKRLDSSDTNRTGVHVYRVNYGEAKQVAKVLNDIFVGGGSGGSFDTPSSIAPRSSSDRLSLGGSQSGGAGGSARWRRGRQRRSQRQLVGISEHDRNRERRQRERARIPELAALAAAPLRAAAHRSSKASGSPPTPRAIRCLSMRATRTTSSSCARSLNSTGRNCRSRSTPPSPRSRSTTRCPTAFSSSCRRQGRIVNSRHDARGAPPARRVRRVSATGVATAILGQTLPGFNFLVGSQSQPTSSSTRCTPSPTSRCCPTPRWWSPITRWRR